MHVIDLANRLLLARQREDDTEPPDQVGPTWCTRFLKRHNYKRKKRKTLNASREAFECPNIISAYFYNLNEAIKKDSIVETDIWNMDETGFRIGIGGDSFIITKRKIA